LFCKVHCIGLIGHAFPDDLIAIKRAGNAFTEACASQYVCQKENWFCKSFGLICVGLVCPCAFVCVVRKLGAALKDTSAPDVGSFFHSRTLKHHWVHGEPHGGNVMLVDRRQQEAIGLAQTFLTSVESPIPLYFHTWYAVSMLQNPRNPYHIRALMRIMKKSGLDNTHNYFSELYKSGTFLEIAFTAELFQSISVIPWKYVPLLHLFELLDNANLMPALTGDGTIHCGLGDIIIHTDINVENRIVVSCNELSHINLSCESDTQFFFSKFSNPQNYANAVYVRAQDFSEDDSAEEPTVPDQSKPGRGKRRKGKDSNKRSRPEGCLPEHFYLIEKMRECGNPRVLESIRTSMMRRFGTAGQLSDFSLQKKSNPGNALRPYHFGCKTVLVVDDDTRSRCMNFITSEKILSLDTESTCPRL
jgi:hypothetical protein